MSIGVYPVRGVGRAREDEGVRVPQVASHEPPALLGVVVVRVSADMATPDHPGHPFP
jgi:hypothetical protein